MKSSSCITAFVFIKAVATVAIHCAYISVRILNDNAAEAKFQTLTTDTPWTCHDQSRSLQVHNLCKHSVIWIGKVVE